MKTPRLKSLELQGYKTFASKTVFEFAPTITAIVGPNGSGKSNIADSIRWVLGEQSYSLLRGKKTEDMIFSGSDSRSRAGMASASIIFDNEEGWLPIDFTEVTVGRRAYRDSLNEYYLNAQKVRLRDVSELLAECGLSQRTYTIIGQGLVDAALSLNPEERRKLFEEAAGISLYRSRKEEALRRLDSTRRNLERVQDILGELRPRLRSLERQAKRAVDYVQVKDDLHALLRVWYGFHWYRLQDQVTKALTDAQLQKTARDRLRDRQVQSEREIVSRRRKIADLRSKLHESSREIAELQREHESVDREFAISRERIRWLDDQISLIESEIETDKEKRTTLLSRLEREKEQAQTRKGELEKAESSIAFLKSEGEGDAEGVSPTEGKSGPLREKLMLVTVEEAKWTGKKERHSGQLEEIKFRIAEMREMLDTLEVEQRDGLAEEARATTELQQLGAETVRHGANLDQAKKRLEAALQARSEVKSALAEVTAEIARLEAKLEIHRGVRDESTDRLEFLRSESTEGRIRSNLGILAEHVRVRSIYKTAIEAAFGADHSGFVLSSLTEIEGILGEIQGEGFHGRAALLPTQNLRIPPPINPLDFPGVIGNAMEFVESHTRYVPIVQLLLGRTLLVQSISDARRVAPSLPHGSRVVTLDGTIVYPDGHLVFGERSLAVDGRESPKELEGAIQALQLTIQGQQSDINTFSDEISSLEGQIGELEDQLVQSRRQEQDAVLQLGRIKLRGEETDRKRMDAHSKLSQLEGERDDLLHTLQSHLQRGKNFASIREKLESELDRAMLLESGDSSGVALVRAQANLETSQRDYESAEARVRDLGDQIEDLDRKIQTRTQRIHSLAEERETTASNMEQAGNRLGELGARLKGGQGEHGPSERELEEAEKALSKLEESEILNREELRSAEREHNNAQIALARRQEEIVGLQHRIEDDFGLVAFDFEEGVMGQDPLPFEGLVEHLQRADQIPEGTEAQVNRLRNQLRRMGAVNPSAKTEYDEVRERVEFLSSQLEDSRNAEEQIQDVIAEMDLLMEREFRKTFDAVAIEFQNVFTHLFAGGSARLTLTDADDLTQTGIDIEARLPGRRTQGLAMLSGGERSLTATSLIFALMKVSPTPFCVMDEVDAMLDDVNVVRFCEMLQELSANTQFVLITHNRQTVQAAEIVYGITMGSDSASQVISLKLEEAEKVIAG